MLTPEQVSGLQVAYSRLIDPITEYLIKDIVRRVSEAGELTSTAAYQAYISELLGVELPKIEKEVASLMEAAVEEAGYLMAQAAEMGYDLDMQRLNVSPEKSSIWKMIETAVSNAKEDLKNLTQTIGFVGVSGKPEKLRDAYLKATDFAFTQTFTGAADYNTAIRMACTQLNATGLVSVEYASGIKTSLEAAMRRNIMSATGLLVEQVQQQTHDQVGADGWEISAHANSAPDHEPIQGKQYTDEEYGRLNGSLRRRIGTLNCGHNAFPIIIGVSEPQYTKEQLEQFRKDNEQGAAFEGMTFRTIYEATQFQRNIERQIRTWKRRVLSGVVPGADTRLLQLQTEYKRFSKATGLRTEEERLEISGFSGNATKEYRSYIEKYRKLRYNSDGTVKVTDDHTRESHPDIKRDYLPNAVIDTVSGSNAQRNRTIYNENGLISVQIHSGDHQNPKNHPYGEHGEHMHLYTWDPKTKKPKKTQGELTEYYRKLAKDILR